MRFYIIIIRKSFTILYCIALRRNGHINYTGKGTSCNYYYYRYEQVYKYYYHAPIRDFYNYDEGGGGGIAWIRIMRVTILPITYLTLKAMFIWFFFLNMNYIVAHFFYYNINNNRSFIHLMYGFYFVVSYENIEICLFFNLKRHIHHILK